MSAVEDRRQLATIEATSAPSAGAATEAMAVLYQMPGPVVATRAELVASLATVEGFVAMAEGWDGYGAARVAEATAANAKKALETLLAVTPCPDLSPNPNGTISLEWESESGYAVLEIGNSRFSFYIKVGTYRAYSVAGDAGDVSTALAQQISGSLFPRPRQNGGQIASVITLPSYVRSAY